MSIIILTMWDEHYAKVGAISGPNKQAYAAQHGYAFVGERTRPDPARPAAWSKIELTRRHLPHYDWAFWTDADSLIMNDAIKLESFVETEADLIITQDHSGLNAGHFLIRSTAWSARFLDEVYTQVQFLDHPWWEQAAMTYVLQSNPSHAPHVAFIEQRSINAYVGNYVPGDFIIHFAGSGRDLPQLLQIMRAWSAQNEATVTQLAPAK